MAIDTLKVARRLREAGFTEPQAEAVVEAVRESTEEGDIATKHDLRLLSTELRAEIAALRAEMTAEIAALRAEMTAEIAALRAEMTAEFAAVRGEMREMEQRLIARIEASNAASMNRVVAMILGTLLVNVVTILGAVFAAVRLLEH
jgi:DNA anti-recombination protein RmuC